MLWREKSNQPHRSCSWEKVVAHTCGHDTQHTLWNIHWRDYVARTPKGKGDSDQESNVLPQKICDGVVDLCAV